MSQSYWDGQRNTVADVIDQIFANGFDDYKWKNISQLRIPLQWLKQFR